MITDVTFRLLAGGPSSIRSVSERHVSVRRKRAMRQVNARRYGIGRQCRLGVEQLESRALPSTSQLLPGGILSVTGTLGRDNIRVALDAAASQYVVLDSGIPSARFNTAVVSSIALSGGAGDDY